MLFVCSSWSMCSFWRASLKFLTYTYMEILLISFYHCYVMIFPVMETSFPIIKMNHFMALFPSISSQHLLCTYYISSSFFYVLYIYWHIYSSHYAVSNNVCWCYSEEIEAKEGQVTAEGHTASKCGGEIWIQAICSVSLTVNFPLNVNLQIIVL